MTPWQILACIWAGTEAFVLLGEIVRGRVNPTQALVTAIAIVLAVSSFMDDPQ